MKNWKIGLLAFFGLIAAIVIAGCINDYVQEKKWKKLLEGDTAVNAEIAKKMI